MLTRPSLARGRRRKECESNCVLTQSLLRLRAARYLERMRTRVVVVAVLVACLLSFANADRGHKPASVKLSGGGAPSSAAQAQSASPTVTDADSTTDQPSSLPSVRPSLINHRFLEHNFRRLLAVVIRDPDVLRLVAKACSTTLWITFGLSLMGTLGLDTKPVLSLLSVSLVSIGFAAKDILNSLLSGVVLVSTCPFRRGDVVSILGHKGEVLEISLKYIRLRSLGKDKGEVLLPVSVVYNAAVVIESGASLKSGKAR